MPKNYRFIDLFAGLGGFHLALKSLGHKCVFASELSDELRELYQINHGAKCSGDINMIEVQDIPKQDIICAGFPCTPFS
ncbi:MAG: DNA cytosine methyltransferase, partial [Chitinophagaceae bacterium]